MFAAFTEPLLGLPVTHAWRGHGSALFLEFGRLSPGRIRRDGSIGNPNGAMGLMLDCGWRLEGRRLILCSFDNDDLPWPKLLACLAKGTVASVAMLGRLPEISLALSTGLNLVSFEIWQRHPAWSIFDRHEAGSANGRATRWLHVQHGRLHIGTPEQPNAW